MNARGMALVTGLVVLAAVALLAITAAGGMTLQRHQAANFQDHVRAEANADAARAAALAWLYSRADTDRQFDCVSGCFLPDAVRPAGDLPRSPEFLPAAWWQGHAHDAGSHPLTGEPVGFRGASDGAAHWLIEEAHFRRIDPDGNPQGIHGVGYYRVLARGTGRQGRSVAVTETIVARPWQGEYEPGRFSPDESLRRFCAQFGAELACSVLSWRMRR